MADAIWNDRFILADYNGLPVSAGQGISMQLNDGKLLIGNDETVLWSGSTALTAMNGSANAISLSGSLYDYDKVAVYAKPLNGHEALKVLEFVPVSGSEGFDWLTWFKGGGTSAAGAIRFGCAFIQHNENSMWVKQDELFQLSVTSAGIAMASNQNVLTKVVGINRKA